MKNKLSVEIWLNRYYEHLRIAHNHIKQIYWDSDFPFGSKFDKKIIELDNLLYELEKIAVKKANK